MSLSTLPARSQDASEQRCLDWRHKKKQKHCANCKPTMGTSTQQRHHAAWADSDGNGGIRPPVRRRSPRVLSLAEREEISRGLAAGRSIRTIAALLGRGDRPAILRR